jgi:hypothetical protein
VSQPDLLTALREATPTAPDELRARVRELTAVAGAPKRRRPGWRLALVVVALAAVAAGALASALLEPASREGAPVEHRPAVPGPLNVLSAGFGKASSSGTAVAGAPAARAASSGALASPALPPPSPNRAQRYDATLYLSLRDGLAVAAAARRAVEIAQALGGYVQATKVKVSAAAGSASVVLRVPHARVGQAVAELSALGRLVGEQVSIADLQAGVDTTGLRIVRLERELAAAINAPRSAASERLVAALSAQILSLQRSRVDTLRGARDATVSLHLATPVRRPVRPRSHVVHHGPFHELGVAFRTVGIGAVYVLALGTPLALLGFAAWLLGSWLRRRREEKLLSRS